MLWLSGGSLIVCVAMIVGLLLLVLWMGLVTFWPRPMERVTLYDGRVVLGEVTRTETFEPSEATLAAYPDDVAARARAEMDEADGLVRRRLFRTGNFDLSNEHFEWISDFEVAPDSLEFPTWSMLVERNEWGRFYGYPVRYVVDGETVVEDPEGIWDAYLSRHDDVRDRWKQRRKLERDELGRTYRRRENARLKVRQVELQHDLSGIWSRAYRELMDARQSLANGDDGADEIVARTEQRLERLERNAGRPSDEAIAAFDTALQRYRQVVLETENENAEIIGRIRELNRENERYALVMATAQGQEKEIPLDQIVRTYPTNQLGLVGKIGVYLSRWAEFLTDEPREANSEGGIFPAIVGTVLMTLIMALLVVPFGVMAALYLREYAKGGAVVSAVRIAINNLAGVPSIVFGVFGLGFFCYGVGGFIDGGPMWSMPRPGWFIALAVVAAVSLGAFFTMLRSLTRPGEPTTAGKRALRYASGVLWVVASIGALLLIATTPFFEGFYRASMPNPTFGKGALVWASFTLALLTLPVVIVATEEALAAVPNSMREGSYACGGSKWQTIKRIVMPRAMPGIMTGAILAMARGAGEVAPLMLVGAVKLAPKLPVSWRPDEHFGIDRSFMHLGFHIYDLGFQSQNSEAAKPLVFTTTLLLIFIVAVLNLSAVQLRSRLRRKFVSAQF
jgi:ABC-type phosphate transport system permease subunit